MNKLTKVVFVFDDSSEVSMEADDAIDLSIETKTFPLEPFTSKAAWLKSLPSSMERTYTSVKIGFILSKVAINGDKELTEFVKAVSAAKSDYEPTYPPSDWPPDVTGDGTMIRR